MGLTRRKNPFSAGGMFTLKSIVVLGALALLNLLAMRWQFEWDTSEGRRHSLAQSTVDILKALEKPVRVRVFVDGPTGWIDTLLSKFEHANRHITSEIVYLVEDAALAEQYGVTGGGTVVVEMGERRRFVQCGEQQLAGAILQLAKGGGKRVVFTSGHGESDLTGQTEQGLAQAHALLMQAGYETAQSLLTEEALRDTSALVIASPEKELGASEAEQVIRFVEQGGGLLVLVDPPPRAGLTNVLTRFDIETGEDYVIELNKGFRHKGYGANTMLVRRYVAGHPIAERMSQTILLRFVRSLILKRKTEEDDKGPQLLPLCVSSPNSWGEKQLIGKEVQWDRGVDAPGPRVLVAATCEPPSYAGNGRLLVAGTSSFATNRYLGTSGNREFLEAAVSWLAGDLDYPLVSQKEPTKKLSLSESQLRLVLLVCVLIVPGISALVGIAVFIRRTRRSN